MTYCPKDGKYCIDDLCRSGRCLHGGDTLSKCQACGVLYEDGWCGGLCDDCQHDEEVEDWDGYEQYGGDDGKQT